MISSSTHPDLESLASFVDGRLAGAERARVVEHLAACEECLEVVAETGNVREALGEEPEESEGESAPAGGEVVRHPRSFRITAPAVAAVAAALALVVVGVWQMGWLLGPDLGVETLAGKLEGSAGRLEAGDLSDHGWSTFRGEGLTLEEKRASFRAGVLAMDLQLLLRAGRRDPAAEVARELQGQMGALPDAAGPLGASYRRLARDLGDGSSLEDLAEEAARADEYLTGLVEPIYYELGKWAEAGRLAARAGDRDTLRSRSIRGASEDFLRAGLEEGVTTRLLEIRKRLEGALDAEEMGLLADDFRSIVAGEGVRVEPRDSL